MFLGLHSFTKTYVQTSACYGRYKTFVNTCLRFYSNSPQYRVDVITEMTYYMF